MATTKAEPRRGWIRQRPPSADSSAPDVDVNADPASGSESEWETDEDEDENAPWNPRPCESLFDGHVSESVEANETYMRVKHGFVIPYRDSVAASAGLLSHLQRKIYRRRQCVWCSRKFSTLEGVRGHMRDAGHVKIKFEPASVYRGNPLFSDVPELDDYVPELSVRFTISRRAPTLVVVSAAMRSTRTSVGSSSCSAAANNSGTGAIGGTTARSFVTITSRRVPNRTSVARAGGCGDAIGDARRNKQMNAVAARSMRVARGGRPRRSRRSTRTRLGSRITRRGARSCITGARAAAGVIITPRGRSSFSRGCGSRVWCRDTPSRGRG